MASSQKQFTTDSKETKVTEEKAAPVDVINIMLEYNKFNKKKGHGTVPLVSTLFNSIKTQKLTRLKHLLTAIVSGVLDKTKAILRNKALKILRALLL